MFQFLQAFRPSLNKKPVTPACLDIAEAVVIEAKQCNFVTITATVDGHLIINHRNNGVWIDFPISDACGLRNFLNKHSVRAAIGQPYKPTQPMGPARRAKKAAKKAAREAVASAKLADYEDAATSIDPGFAIPTDAELEELFQQHYSDVSDKSLARED